MEYETPEISMSSDLLKKGRIPIDRMLEISRQYNL
jgi:hypothetical protein